MGYSAKFAKLIYAAGNGDLKTVKECLEGFFPANVNYVPEERESAEYCTRTTVLCSAAHNGYYGVVSYLLSKGAKVNLQDLGGRTALSYAANGDGWRVTWRLKRPTTVELLLDGKNSAYCVLFLHGKDSIVYCKDPMNSEPLEVPVQKIPGLEQLLRVTKDTPQVIYDKISSNEEGISSHVTGCINSALCHYGKKYIVELLIKAGAKVDLQDSRGRTPLSYATESGRADIIDILIKAGAKVDCQDVNGSTPLSYATKSGRADIVDILVKAGAKVDVVDANGSNHYTPLAHAITEGNIDVAEILIKAGANPDQTLIYYGQKTTLLCWTIANFGSGSGNIKNIEFLLSKGAKLDLQDSKGRTPLSCAAQFGGADIVDILIKVGAKVDCSDASGCTPLSYAAQSGRADNINILLKAGAKVDCPDASGRTPLIYAANSRRVDIIDILIKASVDPNQTINTYDYDSGQWQLLTFLCWAIKLRSKNLFELLLSKGAKLDLMDTRGWLPMHVAADAGYCDFMELFIEKGCNIDVPTKDGVTPLWLAAANGHTDVVKLLISYGADVLAVCNGKTPKAIAEEKGHRSVVDLLSRPELIVSKVSAKSAPLPIAPKPFAEKVAVTEGVVPKASAAAPVGTIDSAGRITISITIPYKELTYGAQLGQGGFGTVYRVTWQGTDAAVKELHLKQLSAETLSAFRTEAALMVGLRHPNIVSLYGISIDEPGKNSLVMEYMPKGSLYNLLHNGQDLPWGIRYSIAMDVATGLSFLHSRDILHRDLKSMNVLLDDHLRAKIGDFGLAQIKQETRSTSSQAEQIAGTTAWMPPELFQRRAKHTKETDVYSLGMVCWEIASRLMPYADASSAAILISWIVAGQKEDVPADCPAKFGKLIRWCWEESSKRPQAQQVVASIEDASRADAPKDPAASDQAYRAESTTSAYRANSSVS